MTGWKWGATNEKLTTHYKLNSTDLKHTRVVTDTAEAQHCMTSIIQRYGTIQTCLTILEQQWAQTLSAYKWFVGSPQILKEFPLCFCFFLHLTLMPFIYSDLWVSFNTTAGMKEGYLRLYRHHKNSHMFTRTRQAHYIQTMQHCLQSCALFHSLHLAPSGLADLPSCSKIIC